MGSNAPSGAGRCDHAIRAAPQNARIGTASVVNGGASAASAAAPRSAICRRVKESGERRTASKRAPSRAESIQRNKLRHPLAAAPTTLHGLMRRLTSSGESTSTPNNASASPIAGAEKCLRGATPAGSTVITALHSQRKRRTSITTISAARSGSRGPRCWRARQPWPRMRRLRPGIRAAPLHCGQNAGRAASTEGGPLSSNQDLTKRARGTIAVLPRANSKMTVRGRRGSA